MWFFLGVKFYENIFFYIRGQPEVLKVMVILKATRGKPVDSSHSSPTL